MMPATPDQSNDWTLDTNVLIRANGGPGTPRSLVERIGRHAWLCWSTAVAQEYQARGAVNLRNGCPPVPVANGRNATWFDAWLTRIDKNISVPHIQRLSGSEQDELIGIPFRDRGDFPFLELARSSHSHRLVTQEEDYDKRAMRGIRRIINVHCLDYATALDECQA
jgi:predicted nucleic acid-binding protein